MTDLKLLVDQGNTRVKWIRAEDGKLMTASAGSGSLADFERSQADSAAPPGAVRISSVAGGERALVEFCTAQWGVAAEVLESTAERGGVRNAYADPRSLGVDRWLAIVGAVARHGKPLVVWDLGTASTLDAVDRGGRHLGGLILPGPRTMLRSLDSETLLKVPGDLRDVSAGPGLDTSAGIRNGVFAAQIGALNQFLRASSSALGAQPRVVVTGGAADPLRPYLAFEHVFDPLLVFRGMLVD